MVLAPFVNYNMDAIFPFCAEAAQQAVRQRYSPDVIKLCGEYKRLELDKINLDEQKALTRKKLTDFVKSELPENVKKVNKHLEKFGVDFRLSKMKVSYAGQNPSAMYGLQLNGVEIKVSTSKNEPSFKDSLSAGDKNSLALAFFLARVNKDVQLSEKIVVFDDPMTSLDSGRKNNTCEEIIKIAHKAKQVIVLSHDMYFLKNIWDMSHKSRTLKITTEKLQSVIRAWDIQEDTQRKYFKHHRKIRDFLTTGEGNMAEVRQSIRNVLEGYLYVKFPDKLTGNEALGVSIGKLSLLQKG
jgi:wobble nucleotide-excising tRNase